MSDLLVTDIAGLMGEDFLRNVDRELRQELPKEKLRHYEIAAKTAEAERKLGINPGDKVKIEGLGERKLKVPMRTWLRWNHLYPGCWSNKQFVDEFYRDNECCRG